MDSRLRGNDGMENFCLIDGLFSQAKPHYRLKANRSVGFAHGLFLEKQRSSESLRTGFRRPFIFSRA
ncbi:hypothetical protein [Neisseria sicca]|uniref:hypothetical protein n=1 Tax=Neisseria sicca TaxID=490 RepID=UPI0011BCF602|nr:hypothetical protein [Neisseria sicca]